MPEPFQQEVADPAGDPPEQLERAEKQPDQVMQSQAALVSRLLAWLLQGESLAAIGVRVLVATHKLRPDLGSGKLFSILPPVRG